MTNKGWIVCVPWGRQSFPSVRRVCGRCGTYIAMSEKNVPIAKRDSLRFICLDCFLRIHPDARADGYLLEGTLIPVKHGEDN
jgi:hypothetical protein